ncbi:hypothetical protein [Velocimicrobium porci]|uniref:MerR family transcriptional regulator n=1 Tax=Velocimicrobium porci TaxID=2606634 RepID=A0A6L5XXF7_9FIRM|nr:hypothetical protein [Velocimicrobium porci]MSS63546.1 hypothetical protein [Velocimicrobium porci]
MSDSILNEIEKLANRGKILHCEVCKGKMKPISNVKYRCMECGYETLNDLGKIKEFLRENGTAPLLVIAQATGVKEKVITSYLREGRLEIPEGSDFYLKCEKCGCSIRYGRFCPDCISELAGGIRAVFNEEAGERPKVEPEIRVAGKMRYMDKRRF